MKNVEIERKWLMDGFPGIPALQEACVEQGYLAFEPNTVRIRKIQHKEEDPRYILTVKGRGMLERPEVELDIPEEKYTALSALLTQPMVRKEFRTYRLESGHILECSWVDPGEPTSFYYAEVEFDSVEEARRFVPPGFLGEEKTNDPHFSMSAYCRHKTGQ